MESAALPAPLTSLVGRDAAVRAAGRLLAAGRRLVSLVGTAGSGKTRLAVAVAAAATPPVWFVDLTTMRTGGHTDRQDPAGDAAGFVLDAFGAARRPDLDAVDTLAAILGDTPTGACSTTANTSPAPSPRSPPGSSPPHPGSGSSSPAGSRSACPRRRA